MINFYSETAFELDNKKIISKWIKDSILQEKCTLTEITYVFCDDAYLLERNIQFLDHDTLTDIISFDYSVGKQIAGDILISIERVKENATEFKTSFIHELHRVMIHGVLHYCGYKDKTEAEKKEMRTKENYYLNQLKY